MALPTVGISLFVQQPALCIISAVLGSPGVLALRRIPAILIGRTGDGDQKILINKLQNVH